MPTVLEQSLARPPIIEGKTKRIHEVVGDPAWVYAMAKNDITAGDGAKHDQIVGKAMLANQTTCNVFRLLQACGIPVAFEAAIGSLPPGTPEEYTYGFMAKKCTMLPYEVVVRREAHGSYLKRAPHLPKGHVFPRLVVEFYLKTSGKKWKDHKLVCDDPLMIFRNDTRKIELYDPKQPNLPQTPATPFLTLDENEVFGADGEQYLFSEMKGTAIWTFLVLEKAWQILGKKLVDFKVEFGIGPDGKLYLSDVIDNDSWRVVDGSGGYIDKQVYRDGGDLDTVTKKYRLVAELTDRFGLPAQSLTLWRGSEKDDLDPFNVAIAELFPIRQFLIHEITLSMHKEPGTAYRKLQEHLQAAPDTVVIAYVGRSNAAGPTLSANTTVPVITVPAGYKEFPDDIWSSLRGASNVPVMTILEPANAVLAALQILAMRNPAIYAGLRMRQEKRMSDM